MADAPSPLILDFLEWIAVAPRPYADVMEAWRTSCPRLPVWEDAVDEGFVIQRRVAEALLVDLTPLGHRFLAEHGRQTAMTHAQEQ